MGGLLDLDLWQGWDMDTMAMAMAMAIAMVKTHFSRTIVTHFAGGSVLHWPGVDGQGALATGDIFNVVADRRWVSFMYSYPNLIPEHPDTIRNALQLVEPFDYAAVYSAWWGTVLARDGKAAVIRSAHRYFEHIGVPTEGLPAPG